MSHLRKLLNSAEVQHVFSHFLPQAPRVDDKACLQQGHTDCWLVVFLESRRGDKADFEWWSNASLQIFPPPCNALWHACFHLLFQKGRKPPLKNKITTKNSSRKNQGMLLIKWRPLPRGTKFSSGHFTTLVFFIELSCFLMRLSCFAHVISGSEHPPMCFVLQEAAQAPLQQPPAQGLHHPLLPLTFSLHPAPLQPSIWPPTLSMLVAGRVSFATSTCLTTLHVPEATWLPCRATQGWATVATTGCRVALLLPHSPPKASCLRGLHLWSQECQLLLLCPATARWRPTAASWGPFPAPSFSMSCKQAILHPVLLLHTCLVAATCSRAPTTPSPCTIPTTSMDTISLLPQGWQQAQRNSPLPKALYSALPLPVGPLERGNTFPQGWIMVCTWSALPPATSRQPMPVTTDSMVLFRAPPHRCLCTWSNQQCLSLAWKAIGPALFPWINPP